MKIDIDDKVLKARVGNLVIYDIDYLLKHLDMEIELLKKHGHDTPLIDFEQIAEEMRKEQII